MQRRDGILWAIVGGMFVTCFIILVLDWSAILKLGAEEWTAVGGIALVIATGFLVFVTELTRRSAERVAKFQVSAAARLSRKQTYSLKWMKEQETKPYCDFVIILKTGTKKHIGVYLNNLGHGPALKMHWKFYFRGRLVSETGREGLRKVASKYPLHDWLEVYVPARVPASSEEAIFRLRDGVPSRVPPEQSYEETMSAVDSLRLMIQQMNIELEIHSIMGQKETIWLYDSPDEYPIS